MRKAGLILGFMGAELFVAFTALAASRVAYRSAYRVWRELDPALERDAGSAGPEIASRTGKMAAAATKYGVERGIFLKTIAAETGQSVMAPLAKSLSEPLPDLPNNGANRVIAQTVVVERNMAAFANDPDPGIQKLQATLQQEDTVLKSLTAAIADRQKAFDSARAATVAAAQIRMRALSQERDLIGAIQQTTADTDRLTAKWVDYYETLAETLAGVRAAPKPTPPAAKTPASVAPAPVVTPLPLLRYTGEWTFPNNGLFHGIEPETIELLVRQENGHATGSVSARFKIPPGSKNDPALRFSFSGDFTNARNQVFNLETSDHAKGRVELIPGSAVDLLEINFETEPKPGKVTHANAVLMRK